MFKVLKAWLNLKSGPGSGSERKFFTGSKNPGRKFLGRVARPVVEPWLYLLKLGSNLFSKDHFSRDSLSQSFAKQERPNFFQLVQKSIYYFINVKWCNNIKNIFTQPNVVFAEKWWKLSWDQSQNIFPKIRREKKCVFITGLPRRALFITQISGPITNRMAQIRLKIS